ncbi:unnamed protein product [Amoebophrya sp. A25]|nr:unnamed protein product [Amoebophrya sp. A25]|eukprot:GSA25T00021408001.1
MKNQKVSRIRSRWQRRLIKGAVCNGVGLLVCSPCAVQRQAAPTRERCIPLLEDLDDKWNASTPRQPSVASAHVQTAVENNIRKTKGSNPHRMQTGPVTQT